MRILFIIISVFIFSLALKTGYERHKINIIKEYRGSDIEAIWKESQKICSFSNPYSRMKGKEKAFKPPTYFPGFYIFGCFLDRIGENSNYKDFISHWSLLNIFFYLLMGLSVYYFFVSTGLFLEGLIFTFLIFFSRWSLGTISSLQTNIIAILPLIWSLFLIKTNRISSYLLFSLSLCLKQIAIFILPLYLFHIYLHNRYKKDKILLCLKDFSFLFLLPLVLFLPFLFSDFWGVFNSMYYSLGREEKSYLALGQGFRQINQIIFIFISLFWYAKYRYFFATSAFFIIFSFCAFNHIFFSQYYLWALSILALSGYEWLKFIKEENG